VRNDVGNVTVLSCVNEIKAMLDQAVQTEKISSSKLRDEVEKNKQLELKTNIAQESEAKAIHDTVASQRRHVRTITIMGLLLVVTTFYSAYVTFVSIWVPGKCW